MITNTLDSCTSDEEDIPSQQKMKEVRIEGKLIIVWDDNQGGESIIPLVISKGEGKIKGETKEKFRIGFSKKFPADFPNSQTFQLQWQKTKKRKKKGIKRDRSFLMEKLDQHIKANLVPILYRKQGIQDDNHFERELKSLISSTKALTKAFHLLGIELWEEYKRWEETHGPLYPFDEKKVLSQVQSYFRRTYSPKLKARD
jgi:hypothetical protein